MMCEKPHSNSECTHFQNMFFILHTSFIFIHCEEKPIAAKEVTLQTLILLMHRLMILSIA